MNERRLEPASRKEIATSTLIILSGSVAVLLVVLVILIAKQML
jgi:hypothetical protein